MDGQGYKIQIRTLNKSNEFEYSNSKGYPEIDELIYVSEMLKL